MKKTLIAIILFSFNSWGTTFCERSSTDIATGLQAVSTRISFQNAGGLFNGGVCWWHARLQRSAAYLATYNLEAPAPALKEVEAILKNLKTMSKVVVIPGFSNFNSFSKVHQTAIQKMLEDWQKEDGFLNQEWRRGISGRSEMEPKDLEIHMESLYQDFLNSPRPIWLMAQIKGIESHSFLLLDMVLSPTGFELKVIDSNVPEVNKTIVYSRGDRFLGHPNSNYTFIPYLGFQKDFTKLQKAVADYCGGSYFQEKFNLPESVIEVK